MARRFSSLWLWFSVAVLCAASPRSARAEPYGPAFAITQTMNFNFATLDNPVAGFDLAMAANGDAIALWQSGPISAPSFYIQRYDARGRILGSAEQRVGPAVRQVGVAGTGNYVLVSEQSDGAGRGVFVTLLNRAGTTIVPQFQVNDTRADDQNVVDVAMNASGMFSVLWSVRTQSNLRLYLKRFHANGVAVAAEQLVYGRQAPIGYLGGAQVAIDSAGNSFVTWSAGNPIALEPMDIWARRYGTNGVALAPAFRVNSSPANGSDGLAMAMNGSGTAVVVWTGVPPGSTTEAVLGQRYSASGAPLGAEFRISEDTSSSLEGLGVAMDPQSGFVVTWHHENFHGSIIPQIVARAFGSDGLPRAPTFAVTDMTNAFATSCLIGMDQGGNFLISWLEHHYTNAPTNRMVARRHYPMGIQLQAVSNGQPLNGLVGAANSFRVFKLSVPSGQATVDVSIFGGVGDADLYVRLGALPTLATWDGRPFLSGNAEAVRMLSFPPGDWYIGVHGYSAYSGLSLQA